MKKPLVPFLFIVIFIAMSFSSFAKGTIKGVILDSGTKEPLIGASISIPQTTTGTVSNIDGSFSLKLDAGPHQLTINFIGYQAKTISVSAVEDKLTDLGEIKLQADEV